MKNTNKQKNTNPIISRQDYCLTQPLEEKQTNKQKLSANLNQYKAYTNHWAKPRCAETKKKEEFKREAWEKETSNTISLKKQLKGREILHK